MIEVQIVNQENINDFIDIPKKLYDARQIVQNESEERKILSKEHTLSKYFEVTGFVCYQDQIPVARCMLTIYDDREEVYIGYFECVDDSGVAKVLFDFVEEQIHLLGKKRIVGPVDASFWIRYRMKINCFDTRPYFSEPNNMPYYQKLWEICGYQTLKLYTSNRFSRFKKKDLYKEKNVKRYHQFMNKGYKFVSPSTQNWDEALSDVYSLMIELYSDFPVYSRITEEDFKSLFMDYKSILDCSVVKLAYYKDEPVAFFIGIPDYHNHIYGKIGLAQIIYILSKRIRSSNYIMLYLGVKKEHLGLGLAMTQTMIENVHKKRASSISAFMMDGKVTQSYIAENCIKTYEYALFYKEI